MYELSPSRCGKNGDVGHARDRPVRPVVEAVQGIDLVRLDGEVEHAGNGHHDQEADEHRPKKSTNETARASPIERPARERRRSGAQKCAELRDRGDQNEHAADRQRHGHEQRGQQLHDGVGDPSQALPQSSGRPPGSPPRSAAAPGTRAGARRPGRLARRAARTRGRAALRRPARSRCRAPSPRRRTRPSRG